MKDLAFRDVVDVVPYGPQWVAFEPAIVVGIHELVPDRLLRVRLGCGHDRVVWLIGPQLDTPDRLPTDLYPCGGCGHMIDSDRCTACGWVALNARTCDICGHLIHPDEPTRCLNCGNDVPRGPGKRVLDS